MRRVIFRMIKGPLKAAVDHWQQQIRSVVSAAAAALRHHHARLEKEEAVRAATAELQLKLQRRKQVELEILGASDPFLTDSASKPRTPLVDGAKGLVATAVASWSSLTSKSSRDGGTPVKRASLSSVQGDVSSPSKRPGLTSIFPSVDEPTAAIQSLLRRRFTSAAFRHWRGTYLSAVRGGRIESPRAEPKVSVSEFTTPHRSIKTEGSISSNRSKKISSSSGAIPQVDGPVAEMKSPSFSSSTDRKKSTTKPSKQSPSSPPAMSRLASWAASSPAGQEEVGDEVYSMPRALWRTGEAGVGL